MHQASKFNVSVTKMRQVLEGCAPRLPAVASPQDSTRGLPPPDYRTWRITFKNAPPRLTTIEHDAKAVWTKGRAGRNTGILCGSDRQVL